MDDSAASAGEPKFNARLVGQSKPFMEVVGWIGLAAISDAPVLIGGETGTGKEMAARTIHDQSGRRNKPFVPVNCAAIPAALMESELFGYERGAFTGATERRLGFFDRADGGTLFLDEIAEMDPLLQSKLLRVLQEGTFWRVGAKAETQVDVRIIAATNRVLSRALDEGRLREDLFHRLNVFLIPMPPLRDRTGDVSLLARTFIEKFNRKVGRQAPGLTPEAEQVLERHRWPGNVRELEHAIQRAVLLARAEPIAPEHLRQSDGSALGSGAARPGNDGRHAVHGPSSEGGPTSQPALPRGDDLAKLIEDLLARESTQQERGVDAITPAAMSFLARNPWRDISELGQAIQYGVAECTAPMLDVDDLPPYLLEAAVRAGWLKKLPTKSEHRHEREIHHPSVYGAAKAIQSVLPRRSDWYDELCCWLADLRRTGMTTKASYRETMRRGQTPFSEAKATRDLRMLEGAGFIKRHHRDPSRYVVGHALTSIFGESEPPRRAG